MNRLSLFLIVAVALNLFSGNARADNALLAQADAAFQGRGDKASLEKAIEGYGQAAAAAATPQEKRDILEKQARAIYFLADAHYGQDAGKQKEFYLKAHKTGLDCLRLNPEIAKPMGKDDIEAGAKAITKEDTGCAYWAAVGLGKWSNLEGMSAKLSNKGKIVALIGKVAELTPQYFFGGPDRYFGTYYAALPWVMGGSMDKSKKYYEASIKIAPFYLGTKVLMAEHYAVQKKDRKLFVQLLNEVIAADIKAHPEVEPENKSEQEKAKELLAQVDKKF